MTKKFQIDTGGTLLTSLVSYYRLDGVNDSYASNVLTNNGSVAFSAGKIGNCVSFSGSNWLSRTAPLSTATTNISLFMWVYINSSSEKGCFAHNGADHATVTNGYSLGVGGIDFDSLGNRLIGVLDGVIWMNFGTNMGTGWHYVGMTRDATTWRGYIDNVVCAFPFTTSPITPSTNFIMGAGNPVNPYVSGPTDYRRFFNNKIDEFGFWNKVLSTQEKTDLYNSGAGNMLISHSPFPGGGLI